MLLMLRDWEQIEVELHFCRSIMSTSPKINMSYPFLTQLENDFCLETATLRQETLRIATKSHAVNHPCPCIDILLCDSHDSHYCHLRGESEHTAADQVM